MGKDGGGVLIFWLIIAGVLYWANSVGGYYVAWYSFRYFVAPDKVHVDPKPRDCDFLTAPLGSKGCHYDAVVWAKNAAGTLVAGDNVPQYGRDTKTGKPIYSIDHGKTWGWFDAADVPSPKVDNVDVWWKKFSD